MCRFSTVLNSLANCVTEIITIVTRQLNMLQANDGDGEFSTKLCSTHDSKTDDEIQKGHEVAKTCTDLYWTPWGV